ncbi:MAG: hypothetical protein ACYTG0_20975, partial [Planctomycetota bacterium]
MKSAGRFSWLLRVTVVVGAYCIHDGQSLCAQVWIGPGGFGPAPSRRFELSDTVEVDSADSTVRILLDRVDEYLADEQYGEAVQTLEEVMEQWGSRLLGVTDRRF